MEEQFISKGIRIADLGLFFENEKALCISDLQLGYEASMHKTGLLLPQFNFSEIKKRLVGKILPLVKAEKIILNGDIKHEFSRISEQEWRETLDIFSLLKKHCKEIVIVKGNHDVFLGPIAKWENIEIRENYFLPEEKIFFTHGHKIPESKEFAKAKTVVVGHEHPAITIRDGTKKEKFKCFLKGKFAEKTLIVQPSLSAITEGTDVLNESFLSPFLKNGISGFEVWAIEDKPYYFGKIRDIIRSVKNNNLL